MARLFLSHASADNQAAIALASWLAEQGFNDVFLDIDPQTGVVTGERWQEALKAAADRCEAVLFLVSPSWAASRWCLAEFLLAKTLHKRIFGVIVAAVAMNQLPPEMTGEWQLCELFGGDRLRLFEVQTPTGMARAAFREAGLELLRRGLMRAGLEGRSFPWPPREDPGRAPYRGLKALEPQDAAIFFGRDAEIVRGMDAIRGLADGGLSALLVILSSSGAGKSSFLRAGLWPRLARDDAHFLPLPVVRPETAVLSGATGLAAALAAAFAALGGPRNLGDVKQALTADQPRLKDLIAALHGLAKQRLSISLGEQVDPVLILPLDQAEELFAPEGAEETQRFLAMVVPLLAPGAGPRLLLIATIRADRYDDMQATSALAGIRQELFNLPPMPAGEFKSVIEGPALRASQAGQSLTIAPALTARLMQEAQGADALPLLGFTLERLFGDYGRAGELTLSHYETLGGLRGIMEQAVAGALTDPGAEPAIPADRSAQLALLQAAFIPALARIDPAGRLPRRRVARLSELPPAALPIVQRLVAARLLVADRREGADVVELAHESLLRNWPALRLWLDESAADLAMLDGVERAAADWMQNDRSEAWLAHRGMRLAEAERVFARSDFGHALDQAGLLYLAACRAREIADQDEQNAREAAVQAERRIAARRLLRRTQLAAGGLLVLLAGAVGLGLVARTQAVRADQARARAERSEEAARQAVDGLVTTLAGNLRTEMGMPTPLVQKLLQGAEGVIDRMRAADPDNAALQTQQTQALGQFTIAYGNLGDTKRGLEAIERAIAIDRTLAATADGADRQGLLVAHLVQGAELCMRTGQDARAEPMAREALALAGRAADAQPQDDELKRSRVQAAVVLARAYSARGDSHAGVGVLHGVLQVAQDILVHHPQAPRMVQMVALFQQVLGDCLWFVGDLNGAVAAYERGQSLCMRGVALEPNSAIAQENLATSEERLGDAHGAHGDLTRAIADYRAGYETDEKLARLDPNNLRLQHTATLLESWLAKAEFEAGQTEAARKTYRDLADKTRRLSQADPANLSWADSVLDTLIHLGETADALHDRAEASTAFHNAVALATSAARVTLRRSSRDTDHAGLHAAAGLAGFLADEDPSPARLQDFAIATGRLDAAMRGEPDNPDVAANYLRASLHLISLLQAHGDPADAARRVAQARAVAAHMRAGGLLDPTARRLISAVEAIRLPSEETTPAH